MQKRRLRLAALALSLSMIGTSLSGYEVRAEETPVIAETEEQTVEESNVLEAQDEVIADVEETVETEETVDTEETVETADQEYHTEIQDIKLTEKGTDIYASAVLQSDDPEIQVQWLQYDLEKKQWTMVAEAKKSMETVWHPGKAGVYWICAQAVDANGKVTTFIKEYNWEGLRTKITGVCVLDEGDYLRMGAAYETNDPNLKFQWKVYDLKKKTWSMIQEQTSDNWTSWRPSASGDYWLHAEAIDSEGTVTSYTQPYHFKGLMTKLTDIEFKTGKKETQVAAKYESNDSKLSFRWLLYDLAEKTWTVARDWSNEAQFKWTPEKAGDYWLHVEAKGSDGNTQSLTKAYRVEGSKITSFDISKNSPAWIGQKIDLKAVYTDPLDEVKNTQFIIWDGKTWKCLAGNTDKTTWTADKVGQYILGYQILGKDGKVLDQNLKSFNVEQPYVNLNGIGINDSGSRKLSLSLSYNTNDPETQFRWLYYDVAKNSWNVIREWSSVTKVNWTAPDYGNYWIHVEAKLHDGTTKSYTQGYTLSQEAPDLRNMRLKANMYSSATRYLILVNRSTHRVAIFTGSQGNWQTVHYWPCSDGAPSTPTVEGTFTVGARGRYFDSGAARCHWYTQFRGNYLFHSVLYNKNGTLRDGRLGMPLSHGCVRLQIDNAKWIYDNIPSGTKVIVYH